MHVLFITVSGSLRLGKSNCTDEEERDNNVHGDNVTV